MGNKKRKHEHKIKKTAHIPEKITNQRNILNIKPEIELKDRLRERDINSKIIPSSCYLKDMLIHLKQKNWNISKLKKYEKGCFDAYNLYGVLHILKEYEEKYWPEIMKINVLSIYGDDIGANCASMYLVGYVAENMGSGEHMMEEYCKLANITEKDICIKAIYNVGKSDGEYLGILDKDGKVNDWDFFEKWIMV